MSFADKFTPGTGEDIIGNDKAVAKLRDIITEGKHALLYGDAGTGKTSSVYAVAADLLMDVEERNMSDARQATDFAKLIQLSRIRPLERPFLLLLDEADGVTDMSALIRLLKTSKVPVVLTANEKWKFPKEIEKLLVIIRFYRPNTTVVSQHVTRLGKALGQKPVFKYIGGDVRSSLISAFYGGEGYTRDDNFTAIEKILKGLSTSDQPYKVKVWLLHNAFRVFRGRELFQFLQALALADMTVKDVGLSALPVAMFVKRVEYPRYFRRQKSIKQGEKA